MATKWREYKKDVMLQVQVIASTYSKLEKCHTHRYLYVQCIVIVSEILRKSNPNLQVSNMFLNLKSHVVKVTFVVDNNNVNM